MGGEIPLGGDIPLWRDIPLGADIALLGDIPLWGVIPLGRGYGGGGRGGWGLCGRGHVEARSWAAAGAGGVEVFAPIGEELAGALALWAVFVSAAAITVAVALTAEVAVVFTAVGEAGGFAHAVVIRAAVLVG